jgi:hypothetical protein
MVHVYTLQYTVVAIFNVSLIDHCGKCHRNVSRFLRAAVYDQYVSIRVINNNTE